MSKKLKYLWDNLERYLMMILFTVMFINVFSQIVARVIFNHPFKFTEELSRYCFVWMVFLGMSFATRYDKHVRVDVFVKHLPFPVQKIIDILIDVLTFFVFSWIVVQGIQYVSYSSITDVYTMPINKGFFVAIIPISGVLVLFRCVGKIFRDIKSIQGHKEEQQ